MGRKFSRRDTLRALGATAVAPALEGCATDAAALEDWELIRQRIDTVVVVMMENRSFDHYMGALSLVEGRVEVDGLVDGMSNPHPDGHAVTIGPASVDCVEDPPHSWSSSHEQVNEGAMDGFVREYVDHAPPERVPEVMGWWDREMLSTYYSMADHYTLCDRWFSSVLSSTWPNRFYAQAAQSGGMQGNDLPPDFPSIYTRLDEEGIDWGVFYGNIPAAVLLPDVGTSGNFFPLERFFERAGEGSLPQVCWVEPVYGRNDDHPPEHPLAGQVFVQSIYEALAQSPGWERTLLIITYDEHGGFYDHVPPPLAADERAEEGFDQLGVRVPTLVVGPWVKANHVSHSVYDHTSWLAFVEQLLQLEPLTERDAAADPMVDTLDLDRMREGVGRIAVHFPTIEADDDVLYRSECNPVDQLFSAAPPPVPTYQLELERYADAHLQGSSLDRRAQGDAIYAWLLDWAEAHGVLRRR